MRVRRGWPLAGVDRENSLQPHLRLLGEGGQSRLPSAQDPLAKTPATSTTKPRMHSAQLSRRQTLSALPQVHPSPQPNNVPEKPITFGRVGPRSTHRLASPGCPQALPFPHIGWRASLSHTSRCIGRLTRSFQYRGLTAARSRRFAPAYSAAHTQSKGLELV